MLLVDTVVSTRGVSAARKHIWHSRTSTAISRAKAHLAEPAMMGVCPHCSKTNRQHEDPPKPVVYQLDQQSESTSGPHLRVEQSGISTATRRQNVYLAQLHINSVVYQLRSAKRKHTGAAIYQQRLERQSDSTDERHSHDCQSYIFTAISKSKAYMSQLFTTNAVIQPKSATQKRIWRNCKSTANGKQNNVWRRRIQQQSEN